MNRVCLANGLERAFRRDGTPFFCKKNMPEIVLT